MKFLIIWISIFMVGIIDGNTYVTEQQIKKQAALLEAEQLKLYNYTKIWSQK